MIRPASEASARSAVARSRRVPVRTSSMPPAMKISASGTPSPVIWCVPSQIDELLGEESGILVHREFPWGG